MMLLRQMVLGTKWSNLYHDWLRLLVLLSSKILANDSTTIERISVMSVDDEEQKKRNWREGMDNDEDYKSNFSKWSQG